MKTLLAESTTPCGDLFKRALRSSRVVKVTKSKEHVKRRLPFKHSKDLIHDLESSTLYVENLGQDVGEMDLARMFKKYTIQNIKLHKKDGYAFITLGNLDQVKSAVKDVGEGCSELKLMDNEQYLKHKVEMRKIKTELKEVKMREQTKDMMVDEEQEQYLVSLELGKLATKNEIKEHLTKMCGPDVKPCHIEVNKKTLVSYLRFTSKVQADFCVKQLLDEVWKTQQPSKGKKGKGQAKLSFAASQEAPLVKKVEQLSAKETADYMEKVNAERKRYKAYLERTKEKKHKHKNKK